MRPDVFARARVSSALALGEGSLKQALDDAAFVIDAEDRIVLWNRAAEEIMGHSAHEVSGQRCVEIFVAQDGERNRLCNRGCQIAGQVRRSWFRR